MPYVYSTRNGSGEEVEEGQLPRLASKDSYFHLCQTKFGSCVGSFEDEPDSKSWVFARCLKPGRDDICLMRMTTVWKE